VRAFRITCDMLQLVVCASSTHVVVYWERIACAYDDEKFPERHAERFLKLRTGTKRLVNCLVSNCEMAQAP